MTKNKKPDKNDKEYKEEIKRKFEEYYETRDKNLRDELIEEHKLCLSLKIKINAILRHKKS